MPSLMTNYQKKVTATRVQKAYSELSQAVKLAEVDYGDAKNWDFDTINNDQENIINFVDKYMKPYIKNLELCGKGWTEGLKKCGVTGGANTISYTLSNGSTISVANYRNTKTLSISISPLGKKGRMNYGKDVFTVIMFRTEGRLLPYGWKEGLTREEIKNGYEWEGHNIACNNVVPVGTNKHACTMLLMLDGWEIKDDYPW